MCWLTHTRMIPQEKYGGLSFFSFRSFICSVFFFYRTEQLVTIHVPCIAFDYNAVCFWNSKDVLYIQKLCPLLCQTWWWIYKQWIFNAGWTVLSSIRANLQYEYISCTDGAQQQHALSSWEKNSTKLEMQISMWAVMKMENLTHMVVNTITHCSPRREQTYGFTEGVGEIQLYTMHLLPWTSLDDKFIL